MLCNDERMARMLQAQEDQLSFVLCVFLFVFVVLFFFCVGVCVCVCVVFLVVGIIYFYTKNIKHINI